MAKRKAAILSDEESDFTKEDSDTSEKKPLSKGKGKNSRQKKKSARREDDDDAPESSEEPPLAKKPKKEKANSTNKGTSKGESGDVVHTTSDGDQYVDLGRKKRATVRAFKDTPLLDIREFYGADGDEKPGKKGISLNLAQWETLKAGANTIDSLFAGLKKK